jgi:uncharacterized protein YodC (DUF2158 family)
MSNQIKEGEIVQLKSGGPAMTVHLVYKSPNTQGNPTLASCTWFDGNTFHRMDFNVAELIAGDAPNDKSPPK